MDFSSLEIFCAVATEQSVTRAAHSLARVQSNVTTRVQQLEDELQVKLFSRSGRRMTLTPSGRTMLEYAQRLLSLAEEARSAMNPENMAGPLRVGAMESTAAARLPALLSGYHTMWPQVELQIAIGTSRSLAEDVEGGRLDCAFVADTHIPDTPDRDDRIAGRRLSATLAYHENMILVLPPNHPAVKGPGELRVKTLAAFPDGCTYRNVLERWLSPGDFNSNSHWKVMELASYHAILACVAAGSCFALCPESILDLQRTPMDVRTQEIATVDTYLVARAGYSSGPYRELLKFLPGRE